jgi:hypothetical protein
VSRPPGPGRHGGLPASSSPEGSGEPQALQKRAGRTTAARQAAQRETASLRPHSPQKRSPLRLGVAQEGQGGGGTGVVQGASLAAASASGPEVDVELSNVTQL